MKKIFFVLTALVFLHAPAFSASETRLVASNYSDRYHVSTCKVAQKISKDELVEFKAPEEALATGLVPCKKCYPPTSSIVSD